MAMMSMTSPVRGEAMKKTGGGGTKKKMGGGLRGAAADAAEKKKSKTAMKKSPKPAAHKKSSKSPAKSKKVESDKKKKSSMKDLETPKSHATPAKSKPTATSPYAPGMKKSHGDHPTYLEMAIEAISTLRDRKGTSRAAIKKFIVDHFDVADGGKVTSNLRLALKRGLDTKALKMPEGAGHGAGRFFLGSSQRKNHKKSGETAMNSSPKVAKRQPAKKETKTKQPAKPKKTVDAASKPKTAKKMAAKTAKGAAASKSKTGKRAKMPASDDMPAAGAMAH